MRIKTVTITRGGRLGGEGVEHSSWYNADAVCGAGRDTPFAARAEVIDNRMRLSLRADDGVNRTRWQTACAADAFRFVDECDGCGGFGPAGRIERQGINVEECSETVDRCSSSGWAAIDGCSARGDGLGIGATALIAAARTLGLRQKREDAVGVGAHQKWFVLICSGNLHAACNAIVRREKIHATIRTRCA